MDRHRVAIVIPSLNEAETIASVVEDVSAYGLAIVVDDGSADGTAANAAAAGAVVVRHRCNLGYDAALNSGFLKARNLDSRIVVTIDADGQHDPGVLGVFLDALEEGADVVIGVRNRTQRAAEFAFAIVGRLLWGMKDPLCGLKAYRIEVFDSLGHFDCIGSIGTELAVHAARTGRRIVQIPIVTRDRASASRFGQSWSANRRILRALWRLLSPTYRCRK